MFKLFNKKVHRHKFIVMDIVTRKFKSTGVDLEHYVIRCKSCGEEREIVWSEKRLLEAEGILKRK